MASEMERNELWSIEVERLLLQLQTTEDGLGRAEVKKRLNSSASWQPRRPTAWSLLRNQLTSPLLLLLLCSAILSFALLDDATNALIIVFILMASSLLSFWQELSAANAVSKLMLMLQTTATVIRNGEEQEIPQSEVVPGDVVRLRAGDLIPGDCRLLTAQNLVVNEAVLTGESFPSEKSTAVLPKPTPIGQRTNTLFLGTHVVSGFCSAVVAYTGRETEFGKISDRLALKRPETGFEIGLRQFGQLLVKLVLAITVVVFAVKIGLQQRPVAESLLIGLALAVGMTPQLLPAITTIVLAAGAKAMAERQVIVKQLLSIENLGSMTVLCADKTGTLTEGTIQLEHSLDGSGTSSERVLRYAYLNAFYQSGFTNPLDRAICARNDVDTNGTIKLDEVPYDFTRKRLSVLVQDHGQKVLITKGAFAHVLERCSHFESADGVRLSLDSQRAAVDRVFGELSRAGLRVLGIAVRSIDAPHVTSVDENDMTFLGFLAFADPPKADARETLKQLRGLGVALKIITGDNAAVAATISHRVGIDPTGIVTGSDLRTLGGEAFRQRILKASVFAEVEPNQKEQIILALKQNGHIVGYLGDGINDVSGLHAADVGISVATAVDVAREAAQVVLVRHDLGALVQGITEGRKSFVNTLKYVFFVISANFGYMLSLAVGSLFLPFEPLLASQILLVNLLADLPAMALATDRVDPEQIQRPRRWNVHMLVRYMLAFGLASSMFDLLTFGTMWLIFHTVPKDALGGPIEELFRTGWFVESTLTGLVIMAVLRTQRPFFLSGPGRVFLFAECAVAIITVLLPYSPFASLLGFTALPPQLLALVLGITVLYGAGMELVKLRFYKAGYSD